MIIHRATIVMQGNGQPFTNPTTMTESDQTLEYMQAIPQDGDGIFLCPRCHQYSDKLKSNVNRHMQKKKACKPSSALQHTNKQLYSIT